MSKIVKSQQIRSLICLFGILCFPIFANAGQEPNRIFPSCVNRLMAIVAGLGVSYYGIERYDAYARRPPTAIEKAESARSRKNLTQREANETIARVIGYLRPYANAEVYDAKSAYELAVKNLENLDELKTLRQQKENALIAYLLFGLSKKSIPDSLDRIAVQKLGDDFHAYLDLAYQTALKNGIYENDPNYVSGWGTTAYNIELAAAVSAAISNTTTTTEKIGDFFGDLAVPFHGNGDWPG